MPRHLNRLCDLSLLAGMADHATRIDESIVAAAAEELHVRLRSERLRRCTSANASPRDMFSGLG